MPDALTISPAKAELKAGDSQTFEARDANGTVVTDVTWLLSDRSGTIGPDGTYLAPARIFKARTVHLRAERIQNGTVVAEGSAIVELDALRSWVPVFGGLWLVLFVGLLGSLLFFWPSLCLQCSPPGLSISPPIVTLTRGQAQQFVANAAVTWTNTVNASGLYVAPSAIDAEQLVTVTATSASDPRQSSMGVVRLSPAAGLSVVPSRVTLRAGEQVRLTASATGSASGTATWLPPSAGTITADGVFTAPNDSAPQSITVLAQLQTEAAGSAAASNLVAGALVFVTPEIPGPCDTPGSGLWRVILLVAWVGAIGGLAHAMGSFATYVGNRELKVSWLWWYALRSPLSAVVAVLVFLVFRAGLGAPDLGLAAGDCLTIAGFAGLVGLFAEPATVKLKDIFEAVFTPRRDPREDKAGQPPTPAVPEISKVEPAEISATTGGSLRITGRNFAEGCQVKIGQTLFPATRKSAEALEVTVASGTLAAGKQTVAVVNKPPSGDASQPIEITVTA